MEDDGDSPKKKARPKIILNREHVIRKLNQRQTVKKASPLMTLQEIFEEAPDKDRFIGDTMFWKYFEDINTERIKHTASVEYRNLRVMCLETVFYLVILLLFTLYVSYIQSTDVFNARLEQVNYWSGCDATGNCKIKEVNDMTSFWRFMQTEFVPRAFTVGGEYPEAPRTADIRTKFGGNDFSISWSPRFVGPQKSNVLLGTVRMRQSRVKPNEGCTVSSLFKHIYPDCYAEYTPSYKSTVSYNSRYSPTYLIPAFKWSSASETQQASASGKLSEYSGDGYMMDFPVNKSLSHEMVADMWNWHWVDRATRGVVIELSAMNINVNVITNSRVIFEFGPTGSVIGSVESSSARVFYFTPSMTGSAETSVFILQIFLFGAFLTYTLWTGYLMYKTMNNFLGENPLKFMKKTTIAGAVSFLAQTVLHYFKYGWNLVDLIILVLFYTHMGYRLNTYAAISSEEAFAPNVIGHPEKFMPFSNVIGPLITGNKILSLLAMFVWIKLFKYLSMSSYFRLLVRILEKCAVKLVGFSVLLLVIFFGFAVAFFISNGSNDEYFSTISSSFLVLFFYLIDGYKVDDDWFQPGKEQMLPMIFCCYILMVYFVLLNIFIAIVLDIVATMGKFSIDDQEKKNPMAVFLWTYFNWMKGVSLVRNDTEESMRSEDLFIELGMLPGIVRKKWIEKKRKMQQVAQDCFAGMELFPDDPDITDQKAITMSDWMLPSSRNDVVAKMRNTSGEKPTVVYEVPGTMLTQDISRAQLQRLMDEDSTLPLLLGTPKAVDVIRRFKQGIAARKVAEAQGLEEHEALSPTKALQGSVFSRIDGLENVKLDDEVPDVPEISELAEEMSAAVTDVRNQFRIQLTGIIEATAVLFEHLVELTQGLDSVRENHEEVIDLVRQNTGALTPSERS